ncbi:hypothetical protein GGI02_003982 [Coemansia sp. RSA 2322]|nr:hypothetical protein GGI02_003982 [Coemansia sp. RSA 2322]
MDPTRYFASSIVPQEALVRQPKHGSNRVTGMVPGQISLLKITASAGNGLEQPIRPGDRFSGVLVVEAPRPISATQIVVEFTASERRLVGAKPATKYVRSTIFAVNLVVWKAARKGIVASTVLSDGIHVFNFVCQMPHLNYPQSVQRTEYEISYLLEGKVYAPKDNGGEAVVALVEKELAYQPLVVYPPSAASPLATVETLCFEKKGKKGKPAIELRAAVNTHQVIPGSKIKLDLSIKELASASWTKVAARLFERAVCREEANMASAAPPLWSVDRELAHAELVRSSVYNFFVADEVIGKGAAEAKAAGGETVSSELLSFPIPLVPCSPLSSEHLEFTHFIRLEVFVPSWLSSDRYVYTDLPIQLMTTVPPATAAAAARAQSRQASMSNLERGRSAESDDSSVMSGNSGNLRRQSVQSASTQSAAERSFTMAVEVSSMVANSLPPRYCDVHLVQRPAPTLQLVKQVNASSAQDNVSASGDLPSQQRLSRQSQSTARHTTMSSTHSTEFQKLMMGIPGANDDASDEKPTPRLPTSAAPAGRPASGTPPPPPLPTAPMPTMDFFPEQSLSSLTISPLQSPRSEQRPSMSLQSYPHNSSSTQAAAPPYSPGAEQSAFHQHTLSSGEAVTMTPDDMSATTTLAKPRQHSAGSIGSGLARTPMSPVYSESMNIGATSDEDAGYFKASTAKKSIERDTKVADKGLFRLRKNSSIKHAR